VHFVEFGSKKPISVQYVVHFSDFGSSVGDFAAQSCISANSAHRPVEWRRGVPGGPAARRILLAQSCISANSAHRPADWRCALPVGPTDRQRGGTQAPTGRLRSVFAYSGQGEGLPASLLVHADGSYPRMYSASTAARPSSYRNTGLMSSSAMSSARSQAKCEMSTSAFANASLSSGG
jgi:hypothetical protein